MKEQQEIQQISGLNIIDDFFLLNSLNYAQQLKGKFLTLSDGVFNVMYMTPTTCDKINFKHT